MYVDFELVLNNLRQLRPAPKLQYCVQTDDNVDSDILSTCYTMVCIWLNCYSAILFLATHMYNSTEYTVCEVDVSHEEKEAYILKVYFEHEDHVHMETYTLDVNQHIQSIARNISSFCVRVLWGNNWVLHQNPNVDTFRDGHLIVEWFRDRSNWIWMRT
jgi:hypothetical protein